MPGSLDVMTFDEEPSVTSLQHQVAVGLYDRERVLCACDPVMRAVRTLTGPGRAVIPRSKEDRVPTSFEENIDLN